MKKRASDLLTVELKNPSKIAKNQSKGQNDAMRNSHMVSFDGETAQQKVISSKSQKVTTFRKTENYRDGGAGYRGKSRRQVLSAKKTEGCLPLPQPPN